MQKRKEKKKVQKIFFKIIKQITNFKILYSYFIICYESKLQVLVHFAAEYMLRFCHKNLHLQKNTDFLKQR